MTNPIVRICALASLVASACGDDGGTGPRGDTAPPAPIGDLRAQTVLPETVTLAWTAPGDGIQQVRAAEYDLRYPPVEITA